MRDPHPKKEIQRVLDRAEWKRFLPPWEVDGQVIKLLSLVHYLATPVKEHEGIKHSLFSRFR